MMAQSQEHQDKNSSNDPDDVSIENAPNGFGKRHILAIMSFLGFINVYCMRVNLSVALVVMVNSTSNHSVNSTQSDSDTGCPDQSAKNHSSSSNGEFNWSEDTQGIILGAFFYGYIITQIPGGQLAEKFGGKKMFGFGVLVTAVLSMLTPVVARSLDVGGVIALRVLIGIGEGVTYPSMHAILGKWAPKWERSKLTTFVYAGCDLGTVVALPISGVLCDSSFLGGWPSAFYVFGAVGCVWFIMWTLLIHDTPAEHTTISQEERIYIENSVGRKLDLPTPWRDIISSSPVWGLCAVYFCFSWGYYTMLTCLPTYMSKIQKYDITQDGFLSALPNLLSWCLQISNGWLSDFLRSHGYLSTANTRKLFVGLGLGCSSCILPFIKYAGCDHVIVVVLLTLSGGLGGLALVGFTVNHLDIACNFAGTLLGITNSFSTAAGIVAPYVVGILTKNNETKARWQVVFYISAVMYAIGAVVFVLLARGREQSWNRPEFYKEREKLIQKETQMYT